MNLNPLLIVGAGTFLGAAGVIAFNVIRTRREDRIQARRDQLVGLARRANLEFVGDRPRPEDLEAAGWFRAGDHPVQAEGFLQGQDRNGRFWIARRRIEGQCQEVLGFQIRGNLNVGQVYIEPVASAAPDPGGSSWAKRVFSKRTPPPVSVANWTVHRQASPKQVMDDQARSAVDRWVNRLIHRGRGEGRVLVGMEVKDGLGWIFSVRPLEGARIDDFLNQALDLRNAVIQEIQLRPATISTPVNTVTGESDRRVRAETAPMFAVEVAEGADLSGDAKTVILSAEDLLREAPAPPKSKRRRKFEIPEPEEEVEVIGTWGR